MATSLWSLPPSPPLVYVENPELAATLDGLPLLALTADRSAARVAVLGADQVSLFLAGGQSGPPIDWRLDPAAFRGALWRRINYLAMADLAGGALWPDLEWVINVLAPAQAGPVEHQGLRWSVSDKIVVDGGEPLGTVEVDRPSLLTFQVINRGSGAHYAYIVNYNGQGQLLQVLPPEGAKNVLHRVGPGQTLDLGHIRLELGAPEEAVRIILSERPLDMARFSQDGLDVPSEPRQAVLRPAPKGSWSTAVKVFKLK